jgi:transposase
MTGRDDDGLKAMRRLRRWPVTQKCRIVEETFVPGASVAVVARRNNVNANQVFDWRKKIARLGGYGN